MNYKKYCKLNNIPEQSAASAKMYYFYKEAEAASTDMNVREKMNNYDIEITGMNASWMILDDAVKNCFAPTYPQKGCKPSVPCAKPKGNNPMYVDNDKHIESSKINYLTNRAECIVYAKKAEMSKTFGLIDDMAPDTAAEFVKRIQDGKFVLSDETKNKRTYDAQRYIKWRDPAVKEDSDGYKAADVLLNKVYQDTQDIISISTPAEGLAALKALDAWTPTVGNA